MVNRLYIKILFIAYLLYVSIAMYINPTSWHLISNVNLIFHEAGHIILIFISRFLSILGGTIFEIGVPLAVIVHFLRKKQYFAAGFAAWWTSTALISVSTYASDARTQLIPLLGGDSVTHDWFSILNTLNMLTYDQQIGEFFLIGSFVAFAAAGYLFYKDYKISKIPVEDNILRA
jgi:hypothetical protein